MINNVNKSEETLMHKAERPSNYFFQLFHTYQAEQIKKQVTCVKFLGNTPEESMF